MNQCGKLFICLLILVISGHVSAQSSHNIANLFFRSRMSSQDPAVTMACFNEYMITTSAVGESYSSSYNKCLMDAKAGRDTIESEMAPARSKIIENAKDVCHTMSLCNEKNSTLGIFTCHSEIGAMNTKAVYSISGNASEYANEIHEKYRLIDLKHEQCCKSAERKYVEDTAVVYRTLQKCLEGGAPTTTTTSTSSTTTTTTSPMITSSSISPEETAPFALTGESIKKMAAPVLKIFN
ncbi:uncharacterized protein LOC142233600 [Haematobia irritans]|uniref:uncharacterized protein LOC142233600 n=1 Tax=Haematobia irritans TaxID=7368 RepID=UPI003F5062AE